MDKVMALLWFTLENNINLDINLSVSLRIFPWYHGKLFHGFRQIFQAVDNLRSAARSVQLCRADAAVKLPLAEQRRGQMRKAFACLGSTGNCQTRVV